MHWWTPITIWHRSTAVIISSLSLPPPPPPPPLVFPSVCLDPRAAAFSEQR